MARGLKSPLETPAGGTSHSDLISFCDKHGPHWDEPSPTPKAPPLAISISGGGPRAALSGLGVMRFLADAGLLEQVRYSSSVSGGSVANGLLAKNWPALKASCFARTTFDKKVIKPFLKVVSERSLKWAIIRSAWKALGPKQLTEVYADVFDNWLFEGLLLDELSPDCRFIFNAANLTTGVRFGFERDVMGDYVMGQVSTEGLGIKVARAVAASAALPGVFPPMELKGFKFPCDERGTPNLVDGAAYDNLGLEPLEHLHGDVYSELCIVSLNAGGLFHTGNFGRIPFVSELSRSAALLYRQTTSLRMRMLVQQFKLWEKARRDGADLDVWARRGVLFGLATSHDCGITGWSDINPEVPPWMKSPPDACCWRTELALVKTSLDRFDLDLCHQLIYRGWWLAGASLFRFHCCLLPSELPVWEDLP